MLKIDSTPMQDHVKQMAEVIQKLDWKTVEGGGGQH